MRGGIFWVCESEWGQPGEKFTYAGVSNWLKEDE